LRDEALDRTLSRSGLWKRQWTCRKTGYRMNKSDISRKEFSTKVRDVFERLPNVLMSVQTLNQCLSKHN